MRPYGSYFVDGYNDESNDYESLSYSVYTFGVRIDIAGIDSSEAIFHNYTPSLIFMLSVSSSDFLLTTPTSRLLYHEVARDCPIVDYHCHLNAGEMATDRCFENIAQLWVCSDPYKHRAMRILGVPEAQITGATDERTKFQRWAESVPELLGSPLHHWTSLELARYFEIDEPLNGNSAQRIWDQANQMLSHSANSYRGLLQRYPVETVCTSDDLLDDLSPHEVLRHESGAMDSKWLPSLRSDSIVDIDRSDFLAWVQRLSDQVGGGISDWSDYCSAVSQRLDVFDSLGCRLSDHGLDTVEYVACSEVKAAELFKRRLQGQGLFVVESIELRSALLVYLGQEYARRGWILQLHLGARRNTSARLRELAGPAGGYAAMGNPVDLHALCDWFGDLERKGALPRINLYSLNPALNPAIAVLTGSFAEDGVRGKIQFGPAWWWNDHRHGMSQHLDLLAAHGVLSTFIGMTTDSRSVLSFVRHEYFRRVFCDWLGTAVESGLIPNDGDALESLVRKLCYENARDALAR